MAETVPIREGYVQVPGGRVWYKIIGSGNAIPLVTLHGGPGSTHWGMTPLEALADERPVVFYDQLGCGKSDRPEDSSLWRVERFVAELHQLRQQLGLHRMHLLGHSWGTMLAMDYYLTHPQGIVSLVMSSPCISIPRWLEDCANYIRQLPPDVQETLARHQQAGTLDTEEYKQAMEEFYRRHVFRLDPLPEALLQGRSSRGHNVYATMWGPNEFYMEGGNLKDYDRSGQLPTIKVPTLFSCGRVDEAAPGTTAWYHSLTPGSEFVVYEHSAHMPHWEETARYLEVVRDFLQRVELRS
jgi:proline iminopeptidase